MKEKSHTNEALVIVLKKKKKKTVKTEHKIKTKSDSTGIFQKNLVELKNRFLWRCSKKL